MVLLHADPPRPVVVTLPAVLLRLFPGAERRVGVRAPPRRGAGAGVGARGAGMRDRLCDSTPALRRHLNIFVDGERAGLETPLTPGAEMVVMTAVSGG